MEGRGKSRRRNPYQTWKRRASAMLAVLLTLSLVLGDISGLSRTVMAGQRSVKEEFRIHREAILKAAEEAIEKGEPLSQPLAIVSDEEKTETKYQELLPADGTVYEIFPEIEQVQDVDSLELRVFIHLEEGADPASYTLTGEEELIFLYVNGGGVTAEGRVNIDGYVSDFIEVEPLEEEDDAVGSGNAGGSGNTGSGNAGGSGSAVGAGSENGNGSVDESGNAAGTEKDNGNDENVGNKNGSGTISPEDSAADLTQSADEEEVEDKTTAPESSQKPEDTLPAETEETEEAEETEADKKEDAGKPEKNPAESGADVSAETGDKTEEKETAGSTDEDGSADKDAADKDVTGETEKEEDTDNSEKEDGTEATGDESEDKDEDKNTSVSDDDQDENTSDDDVADTNDAEGADEKDDTGSTVTVSLRQIQRVAASLASDSDAEKETTGNTENGSNGSGNNGTGSTGAGNKNSSDGSDDDEDSYYENTGDPFDEEDAAALEDEEAAFKKVKKLDGIRYDEAVLDEVLAIRAFVVSMEDAGFDKEELLEGAHHLTYTVSEGEARVVYNPEYVRDEAVVTFGIIPAEGMEVYQVTANGEALAETEKTAAIASASEAKRASRSEADVDEERAVYYQIPQVLEDQDVQIQVVKEGQSLYPEFKYEKEFDNGVTVTVSAEEGILPLGTKARIEEVTAQVEEAVVEMVESEATEDDPIVVNSVLAYDITLIDSDGNVLDDSWNDSGFVKVEFSGSQIEERSEEASFVEIAHLETETNVQKEKLTVQDVAALNPVTDNVEIPEAQSVSTLEFDAEHFSTYMIIFKDTAQWNQISIEAVDMNGDGLGSGYSKRISLSANEATVQKIAEGMFGNNGVPDDYTFIKAVAIYSGYYGQKEEFTFSKLRYYYINSDSSSKAVQAYDEETGEWKNIKQQNSWNQRNWALKFYFDEKIPVSGTISVSGQGYVEVLVNGEVITTVDKNETTENISLPGNGFYTLKFYPDKDCTVGALYVNELTGLLDRIDVENRCVIPSSNVEQKIKVYFSEKTPQILEWKRSDDRNNNKESGSLYGNGVIRGSWKDNLDFTWSDLTKLSLTNTSVIWDGQETNQLGTTHNPYYGDYVSGLNQYPTWNFATWRYHGDKYELRRFQTTFTLPEGYSTSDYIRLKTVGSEAYSDYNGGNIIPINDDIFIFVYKKDDAQKINDRNYTQYLAFWTGTSNQGNQKRFHGILGTEALQYSRMNVPFPYTDGWFCEAELDNIGELLFERYPDATSGDEFILDVFVGEYASGGGMDELMLEFVKGGYGVVINYYKDEVSAGNYLGVQALKGLELGTVIDLTSSEWDKASYLNKYKSAAGSGYQDGIQPDGPYEVTADGSGVINVVYKKNVQQVNVEYYTRTSRDESETAWVPIGVKSGWSFPIGETFGQVIQQSHIKDGKTEFLKKDPNWYDDGEVWHPEYVVNEETKVIKVVYTRKYGSFPILKELQGYTGDTSGISKIRFQMYEATFGENGNWVKGNAYGDPITLNQWKDNSKGLAEINHLEGGYYILKETASADGYNLLTEDIRIQITLDNKEVVWKVFDEHGDELNKGDETGSGMVKLEASEDGKGLCLKVINTLGAELPETGGPGLIMMERFGWMLLLLAMAGMEVQIFSRRRRKEQ